MNNTMTNPPKPQINKKKSHSRTKSITNETKPRPKGWAAIARGPEISNTLNSESNNNGHINNYNAEEIQQYLKQRFDQYCEKAKMKNNEIGIYKAQESGWGKISKKKDIGENEILNEIAKGL